MNEKTKQPVSLEESPSDATKSPDKSEDNVKSEENCSPEAATPSPTTSSKNNSLSELNGKDKEDAAITNGNGRVTRSRSSTPKTIKKPKETATVSPAGTDESPKSTREPKSTGEAKQNGKQNGEDVSELKIEQNDKPAAESPKSQCEMEPLVLETDDPEPELQFDENSDLSESVKESPVINRCFTRRSQSRNIPTPKTPKAIEDRDSDQATSLSTLSEMTNNGDCDEEKSTDDKSRESNYDEESVYSDNLSTKAVIGSDSTRLDFVSQDSSSQDFGQEESTFLSWSKEKTFTETLRGISPRRTIRSVNDDYRKMVLKNNFGKSDLNFVSGDDVRVGVKRKDRSRTPENNKRAKIESSGLLGLITSPLNQFKNRFKFNDARSSTPKLTGYKMKVGSDESEVEDAVCVGGEINADKRWCTIM